MLKETEYLFLSETDFTIPLKGFRATYFDSQGKGKGAPITGHESPEGG